MTWLDFMTERDRRVIRNAASIGAWRMVARVVVRLDRAAFRRDD